MIRCLSVILVASLAMLSLSACNRESTSPATARETSGKAPAPTATDLQSAQASDSETDTEESAAHPRRKFQPIQLSDKDAAPQSAAAGSKSAKDGVASEKQVESVIAALQPFQVVLGTWRWTTRKRFGGFAKSDEVSWAWDFKTNVKQPALRFEAKDSPYFKQGWLTWLPADERFRLTVESPEGGQRVLEGTWAEGGEPKDVYEGKKAERTYKLELLQTSPAEGEQWKFVLNQQDNNRCLWVMTKRPPEGKRYGTLDTLGNQRQGTSFAVADSDNPDPKCIISGGLGTMSVTYKGKTYPVCCSGCAAAFNDDPERWLAKYAKSKSAGKPQP